MLKNNSLANAPEGDSGNFDQVQSLVDEFELLLADEHLQLESAIVDRLEQIAEQKQRVMDSLFAMEPGISNLLEQSSEREEIQKLKFSLNRCRDKNKENKQLSLLVLNHTNKSLDLLRSLQMMDDLSLYGSGGELNVKREQRTIGSA